MQSSIDRFWPPDSRRTVLVRVADVPVTARRKAAQIACRDEHDPYERLRLRMLAEEPGDLTAWIAP